MLGAAIALTAVLPGQLVAQGVTTSMLTGLVTGPTGEPVARARVTAIHQPSGTTYQTEARSDGRFTIPGMRVGGPYVVSASFLGYSRKSVGNVFLNLGVTTDVPLALARTAVALTGVTVNATNGAISADRTGAATTVSRATLEALPTISRTIGDFTRLTPQASGSSFAGQDNRLNNITIDGSYFNNSFGLAGQPGGRTGVAPIPLDAVDQIQVAIAPFDVRQGNFVGAGVNAVTKSGTNDLEGSVYYLGRNQEFNGVHAGDVLLSRSPSKFGQFGIRLGGPILRNKLFFFTNFESDNLTQPGSDYVANTGGQPVTGNTTRVLASDLTTLSAFLQSKFNYATGDFTPSTLATPSRRLIAKLDYNATDRNKFSFRYIGLDSKSDNLTSNSGSLGNGNRRSNSNSLSFANSNYAVLENIKSGVGEWNAQVGSNMSNNLILGYTTNNESREPVGAFFPLVDILKDGLTYTSFGFEPFTPANQLYYNTAQLQDNFSIFTNKHDLTFGATAQHYRSTNVFFFGSQSAYVYNSLDDFYADANDFLANPNRTTSPVTLNKFQVAYNNIPGQTEPVQPLDVVYAGAYAQDAWRATDNLKITLGLRFDVPKFKDTGFANAEVDGFTFLDENRAPVTYSTSKLPNANVLFSPRLGVNWDVHGDRSTQLRGGTGIFTGSPAYVWISNQIGNNGVLTGFEQITNTQTRPFNPNPDTYKPTSVTGAPARGYGLNFTDPGYRFPQIWRSDIAVDQKLPYGMVGTVEALYGKDVNGTYYINANLTPPIGNFTGADQRPRYAAGNANRVVSKISNAIVLKNQSVGYSYNLSGSLEKAFSNGFFAKAAYNYGVARNTVDPGSIASGTWYSNEISGDPNNPGLGYSAFSPGHREFVALSYRREYSSFGATSVSLFAERRTQGNASYTFAGDANNDGGFGNDLLYVPRDRSEMNFVPIVAKSGTVLFSADQQAAAWDAFINQDPYLRTRRGQYAERNGFFLPQVVRADLSVAQDIFRSVGERRNTLQVRLDILNVGNLLNREWGVGARLMTTQPLIASGVDGNGALQYKLQSIAGNLISSTFQPSSSPLSDVYRMQLGLRYSFN
jgi:outer membrane receptor protein involved in Fe transport